MKVRTHLFFFLITVISTVFFFEAKAQETQRENLNCFSILVGKNATIDGSVMFAHNEDDSGDRLVNWYKVPHENHNEGETITLKNGAVMNQAKETWSYFWLEIPEMEFSDTYINEWGVIISSDACRSREKEPELTDGGIGYWLRRAMAERARSAKEAVKIGGELVEKYGYSSSGRTYCIADPNEAWMMAVVNGKHWVAQRIPDDHVAIIPNYYTITAVNLFDTANFLGSPDIFDYAIQKGWLDPAAPSGYNFRELYSDPGNLEAPVNKIRHWRSINMLSEKQYNIDDELPFSFKPKEKISLTDLFKVLRDHNEGSEYDETDNYTKGNPHEMGRTICSNTTQYGFVAQLRSDMPVEVGAVIWLAPFRQCVHPFVPWYFGMINMPENFATGTYDKALQNHFEEIDNVFEFAPDHHFLKFVKDAKAIDEDYGNRIVQIQTDVEAFESELLEKQEAFEKDILIIYNEQPELAKEKLTEYSKKQIKRAVKMTED